MDVSEREAKVQRFVDEVWNGRKYEAAGDLYSEDLIGRSGRGLLAKQRGSGGTTRRFPTICMSTSTI